MTQYWSRRVEDFSRLRQEEFAGEKHRQWHEELQRKLPADRELKILDIGTGTGFFAFLLAEMGHRVTGIDLTPGMIAEARRIAKGLGRDHVDFYVMDAEKPDFPDGSFDVIVTRKLTWTLPHLPETYARWHRLLKPDGMMINFDADYCREKEAEKLPENHAHMSVSEELMTEYREMKEKLRPVQKSRPFWDAELLKAAGFHGISIDDGVWERVYREKDRFYDPTPGFGITAYA